MNILAFFAHPDDETMLCGGLLALLSSAGHFVHYLCCTRGEGGECGEPPVCTQDQLGQFRSDELNCAVHALGGTSLKILNYIDPLVGPENTLFSFTEDVERLKIELAEQIVANKIDIVISHGSNGEYGHPGHLTVFHATQQLINTKFTDLTWYTVQGFFENSQKPHLLNKNDPADWIIDISPVLEMKLKAANCHKSQQSLFVRRKSNEIGRLVSVSEVIQKIESYHLARGNTDFLLNMTEIKSNLIPINFLNNEI